MKCFVCEGSGLVYFPIATNCCLCFGKGNTLSGDCNNCDGIGKVSNKIKVACNSCYGKGYGNSRDISKLSYKNKKACL